MQAHANNKQHCRSYLLNDGVVDQRNATLVNLHQTNMVQKWTHDVEVGTGRLGVYAAAPGLQLC